MRRPFRLALVACCAVLASPAFAQDSSATSGESMSPEEQAYVESLRKLEWVSGPQQVEMPGKSKLDVPDGYVYLDQANTKKYLELNENIASGTEVMFAPDDLHWTAYLEFVDEGYVKDDDKIDADELLKALKDGTEEANAERRKRGWAELHVVGWAAPPKYNAATKRLEWATVVESEHGRGVNFFTKVLGRRGHASIQMLSDEGGLDDAQKALDGVLGGYRFDSGETYADFKPGDKVAEYGLAAMVLGGAAAVATKKGFFGALAGFFAAAWKFILAAVVAAGAWLKNLFKKKD